MERKPLFPVLGQTGRLFPVAAADNAQETSPDVSWLSNASFKVSSSVPPSAPAATQQQQQYPAEVLAALRAPLEALEPAVIDVSDDEDDAVDNAAKRSRPNDEETSSESEADRSKRRKKEKKARKVFERDKRSKKETKRKKTDKEKILEIERRLMKDDASRKALNVWLDGTKGDRIYEVDSKGDQDNLTYGALYRLNVPIYYRRRRCLGLGRDEGVTFDKAGYVVFKLGDRSASDKAVRYTSNRHIAKEFDPEYKRVHFDRAPSSTGAKSRDVQPAFIPLVKPQKQIDREDGQGAAGSGTGGVLDKREQQQQQAEEDEGESHEQYLQRRAGELNQYTREHPHDIAAWLDFVRFQDDFVQLGRRQQVNKAALIEKKIAIYERALVSNKTSETLALGLLKEARELWDQDKLQAAWRKALAQHADKPVVWQEYVEFLQGTFRSFTVTALRQAYGSAIQTIQATATDAFKAGSEPETLHRLESTLLDMFCRYLSFEKQAGYCERAVGAFQALLEFNLFAPSYLVEHSAQLRSFAGFWESETARIGEEGAVGWSSWLGQQRRSQQQQPSSSSSALAERPHAPSVDTGVISNGGGSDTSEEEPEEKRRFARWLSLEEQSERQLLWLPARPLAGVGVPDDEELTDPERVVLFDDLQDLLVRFTCDDLRLELALRFLEFLDAKLPVRSASNDEYAEHRLQTLEELDSFFAIFTSRQHSWEREQSVVGASRSEFIRRVFGQLLVAFPHSVPVAKNFMWFEGLQDPTAARKLSRTVMKEHRENLLLWHATALVEIRRGKLDEARRIFGTALSALPSLPPDARAAAPLLYRAYSEMERPFRSQAALHILVCMTEEKFTPPPADQSPPSSIRVVKARKVFQQSFGELSSVDQASVHFVVCYALFEYLASASEAAAAVVFEAALKKATKRSRAHEELFTAYISLLLDHSKSHPMPPRILRAVLGSALKSFPLNALFTTLFIENEAQSHFSGHVRQYFDDVCTVESPPFVWLFAIQAEIARHGSLHRIRALFEKALESAKCRQCVLLWRLYMLVERQAGQTTAAKAVFYRAVRFAPFSKRLWLDSIRVLRDSFDVAELNDVLKILAEKEIRLHHDI